MKNIISIFIYSSFCSIALFSSCKKDDKDATNPVDTHPQEQITTVIISGYDHNDPDNAAHRFSVKWEDLDGNGGNAPVIDSLLLDTGITYHASILLLDKTQTPFDTISNEVEELKNIHQFFYTPDAALASRLIVQRLDMDNNNPPLPVGLQLSLGTSGTFSLPLAGSLKVVLSHYDGIPKTAAPSPESDIDIDIPVRLK